MCKQALGCTERPYLKESWEEQFWEGNSIDPESACTSVRTCIDAHTLHEKERKVKMKLLLLIKIYFSLDVFIVYFQKTR